MLTRGKNDITQWFKFFLVGIIETAKKGILTFDNILQLQKLVDKKTSSLGRRSANARKIVNYLYEHPIANAATVGKVTGLSPASTYKLINDLEELELLKEVSGGKRGKMYVFENYLKLFTGKVIDDDFPGGVSEPQLTGYGEKGLPI